MSWKDGPILGFDTETTGVDVVHDRIVTAAVITRASPASPSQPRTWLIDPGVEIPAAASAIHGVTTERARADGAAPVTALEEIAVALHGALAGGVPVVAFNASFDLTLLEHELRRHGLPTLHERLGCPPAPVIDPLVLDRGLDRYRKGKRTLIDLCAWYGVADGAALHSADVDAGATLDVLAAILRRHPELAERTIGQVHTWQREKHRAWAEGFNEWLARKNPGRQGPEVEWPTSNALAVELLGPAWLTRDSGRAPQSA